MRRRSCPTQVPAPRLGGLLPASVLVGALASVLVGAAACVGSGSEPGAPATAPPATAPPAVPEPVRDGPCPYLDASTVEMINGQRVGSVRTSAEHPHPACFFYRHDGDEQLRVWIVVATEEAARATVDAAAPVATSDLAELPGGWSGGSQPTSDGAVFAVARAGTAVVVTTNQPRTAPARRIADEVTGALGP